MVAIQPAHEPRDAALMSGKGFSDCLGVSHAYASNVAARLLPSD
jgi:hypothetical protein